MLHFVILCMFVSPLLGVPFLCIGLYNCRNKISRGYAVPFAFLYAAIGYNLSFAAETDLTRYYQMVDRLKGQELIDVLCKDSEKLYTRDLLFFLVSKMDNNSILACIVGFFCYIIIFYVFFDMVDKCRKQYNTNCNLHVFMTAMVMVSIISPYSIIGNVRCVFSYIIISFAAYREWIQKKKNIFTLILYIIPIGLHTSAIIVLIVRICIPFVKRFSKPFIIVALLMPTLIEFAYDISNRINMWDVIGMAISKAYYYLNWTEGGWADQVSRSISDKVGRIYGAFFLTIIIILYFKCKENTQINGGGRATDYLYAVSIIAIGLLSIKTGAFWRFEAVVVLFCHIILLPVAMRAKKKNIRYLLYLLYLSAFIMFILNSIHFARNIIMRNFVLGYISTSVIEIVWYLMKGFYAILGG